MSAAEERIDLEEVPLTIATTYHDHELSPCNDDLVLAPGHTPFILFQMKQEDGAVVLEVDASLIEGEEELIETLEVFFETMLEDRMRRGLIPVDKQIDDAVGEYLDEELARRNEDEALR